MTQQSSAGAFVEEEMICRGWPIYELAERSGITPYTIIQIILSKTIIDDETSCLLSRVFGQIDPLFWSKLDYLSRERDRNDPSVNNPEEPS